MALIFIGTVLVLGVGLIAYTHFIEAVNIQVKEIEITVPDLKMPVTILHISDMHLHGRIGKVWLANFKKAMAQADGKYDFDLALYTGDYIDDNGGIVFISDLLSGVKTRYGSYGVMGNHDYWQYGFLHLFYPIIKAKDDSPADSELLKKTLKDNSIRILQNENAEVRIGSQTIEIYGLEAKFRDGSLIMDALKLDKSNAIKIVLSHYPDSIRMIDGKADVFLAGHTHGGQMTFFGYPLVTRSKIPRKHIAGLTYYDGTPMYVSSGSGTSRFAPFRLFAPPEIAVIKLRGKE